jgi:hypothetical protein
MATTEYTRLHITPLNPTLLTTILPPSILPNARNISYHTVQTFPEKAYGYVELPIMDAEKIKKKLNGSILKGTKVRIEKARPGKEVSMEEEEPERPKKKKDSSKKRKRGDEAIPGVDIGERSVKRGWTTPAVPGKKDKDKKIKSKYTTGSECLFKTVLPPNVVANTDRKKDKKRRKEAVVHEFSKTTKYATFLRGNTVAGSSKSVAEFVEGKGWVDEEGNVVEQVKKSKKTVMPKMELKAPVVEDSTSEEEDSDDNSSEDESDHDTAVTISKVPLRPDQEDTSDESSSEEEITPILSASSSKTVPKSVEEDSETSTSGSSEDSDSDSESSKVSSSAGLPSASQPSSRPVSRPQSSSGPPLGLSIKIPSSTASTPISAVHPLEALYKKPKADGEAALKAGAPTFSFFGADGDADEEMDEVPTQLPLTPFTQRDFEYRGIRSAAPTPDTAHPNKKFVWPTENSDDKDDDVPSSPIRQSGGEEKKGERSGGASAESDFQKWFYENRGETSRAWKKRRRVAAKEKKHREKKKRGSRAV